MTSRDSIKKQISYFSRHLQKLKEQQALAGASVDPKILIQIEDIEAEIERLQAELVLLEDNGEEQTQLGTAEKAWWDEIPDQHVGGDVIIAEVGAGASGITIGKNITQIIYDMLGEPLPDDRQVIEQKMSELIAALQQRRGELDASTADMAEFQIKLLQSELTKTKASETPSASTITQVGDWLLDNVPQIAEILTCLFATPAAGKVVGKAGEVAVEWVKKRLGSVGDAA